MKAKTINEEYSDNEKIVVKCFSARNCNNLGDYLSGMGIINYVNLNDYVVTIICKNKNSIVANILEELPFDVEIIE